MKNLLSLTLLLVLSYASFSQTTTTSVTLNKISQPALRLDLPVDDDVTEDLFKEGLKKNGFSEKNMFSKHNKIDEGFYALKSVRLEGMNEPVDLYVKFEQRGKKSSNESTLTMLVSKEGGFITSSSDRNTFEAAEKFMNGLVNQAAIYKLQKAIEEQEDELKDAEKKYSRLKDDEKSMEKKIENLQKDLKENREDQKSQQRTVEEEKKKLEQFKDEMKKYS